MRNLIIVALLFVSFGVVSAQDTREYKWATANSFTALLTQAQADQINGVDICNAKVIGLDVTAAFAGLNAGTEAVDSLNTSVNTRIVKQCGRGI